MTSTKTKWRVSFDNGVRQSAWFDSKHKAQECLLQLFVDREDVSDIRVTGFTEDELNQLRSKYPKQANQ